MLQLIPEGVHLERVDCILMTQIKTMYSKRHQQTFERYKKTFIAGIIITLYVKKHILIVEHWQTIL